MSWTEACWAARSCMRDHTCVEVWGSRGALMMLIPVIARQSDAPQARRRMPRACAKPAPAAGCSLCFDAGLRNDRSIGGRLGTHAAGERLRRAGRDLEGLRSEAILN